MNLNKSRGSWTLLTVFSVSLGSFLSSGCGEDVKEFTPVGRYEPETNPDGDTLNFGNVAVGGEKTLVINVFNDGSGRLTVSNTTIDPGEGEGKFQVALGEDLATLAPGRTSTISVTYRPCPAAWNGDIPDDSYDLSQCPTAPDLYRLNVVDNDEGAVIKLAGQPAQAPQLQVACALTQTQECGVVPQLGPNDECIVLSFPEVNAGSTPCDLVVELRNTARQGQPTGDLLIERLELLVKNIDGNQVVEGTEAGFEILDLDGNPMVIDSGNPLVVPIPVGQDMGAQKVKVRFKGTVPGTFSGQSRDSAGFRIYSNDPDHRPLRTISVRGTGTAPDIRANPEQFSFGAVPQGSTATTSVCVGNLGNSTLTVDSVSFETDRTGAKFVATPSQALPFDILSGQTCALQVNVAYTPAGGQDADLLLISSNDPDENPLGVPISGGAVPRIETSPEFQLVFALPNPLPEPPIPPRTETLTIRNIGDGDLSIQQFNLTGPGGSTDHPSVDDFTVQGCASFPCQPNITLCSPRAPGCSTSEATIDITYANDDASTVDQVEFSITSNDPFTPTHTVVLAAQDVPCLFPTPVITTVTVDKQVGMPVCMEGLSSSPGGPPGGMTTIEEYTWSQVFGPVGVTFVPSGATVATERVCFTTEVDGTFKFALHVKNSCGQESQTPATELMTIVPN